MTLEKFKNDFDEEEIDILKQKGKEFRHPSDIEDNVVRDIVSSYFKYLLKNSPRTVIVNIDTGETEQQEVKEGEKILSIQDIIVLVDYVPAVNIHTVRIMADAHREDGTFLAFDMRVSSHMARMKKDPASIIGYMADSANFDVVKSLLYSVTPVTLETVQDLPEGEAVNA